MLDMLGSVAVFLDSFMTWIVKLWF